MLKTSVSTAPALAIDVTATGSVLGGDAAGWQSFTATSSEILAYVSLGILNAYTIGELRIYTGEGTGGTMLASVMMPAGIAGYNNSPVLNIPLTAGQIYTIWVANKNQWLWQGTNIWAPLKTSEEL